MSSESKLLRASVGVLILAALILVVSRLFNQSWWIELGQLETLTPANIDQITSIIEPLQPELNRTAFHNELMAMSKENGDIVVKNVVSGNTIHTLSIKGEVRDIQFSADGSMFAVSVRDVPNRIQLWDTALFQPIGTLIEDSTWVSSFVFAPDNLLLAAVDDNQTIKIWDVSAQTVVSSYQPSEGNSHIIEIHFDFANIRLLAINRDGTLISWDVISKQWQERSVLSTGILEATFSPQMSQIGYLLESGGIGIISLETNERLEITNRYRWIRTISFSSDGKMILATTSDNYVLIWDTTSLKLLKEIYFKNIFGLVDAQFLLDNKLLAIIEYGRLRIWGVSLTTTEPTTGSLEDDAE